MRCKIVSCYTEAVAGGLCAKHYMRLRRTGDPTVTRKPGPKPGDVRQTHRAAEAEVAGLRQKVATLGDENIALRRESNALRGEVASLRRQLAAKPKQPAGPKPPPDPNTVEAKLRAQIRELRARLRGFVTAPKNTLFIGAADRRLILSCLHPDITTDPDDRKRLTKAFQKFNGLRMQEVED